MKRVLLLLAMPLLLLSCEKDEPMLCETDNTGVLLVKNYLVDDFNIYLDGAYLGQVRANQDGQFTVSARTYALTANQSDGGGNNWSLSLTVYRCQWYTATLE